MKRFISTFLLAILLLQSCIAFQLAQNVQVEPGFKETQKPTLIICEDSILIKIFETVDHSEISNFGPQQDASFIHHLDNRQRNRYNSKVRQNAIFGNIGGLPMLGTTKSIYYERMIKSNFPSAFVRAGYEFDHYPANDTNWHRCILQLGALFGGKASHFELGIGGMYTVETSEGDNPYFVSGSIGYRYQKSTGGLFRIGVGVPELAYVGFGLSF